VDFEGPGFEEVAPEVGPQSMPVGFIPTAVSLRPATATAQCTNAASYPLLPPGERGAPWRMRLFPPHPARTLLTAVSHHAPASWLASATSSSCYGALTPPTIHQGRNPLPYHRPNHQFLASRIAGSCFRHLPTLASWVGQASSPQSIMSSHKDTETVNRADNESRKEYKYESSEDGRSCGLSGQGLRFRVLKEEGAPGWALWSSQGHVAAPRSRAQLAEPRHRLAHLRRVVMQRLRC